MASATSQRDRRSVLHRIGLLFTLLLLMVPVWNSDLPAAMSKRGDSVMLPKPSTTGTMSVEEALRDRRSVREFDDAPLSLQELSQLLWAAQGLTGPMALRTAPSAGALYPLSIYVVVGDVAQMAAGLYLYGPTAHALKLAHAGDRRAELSAAALGQGWIKDAPVSLVIVARYQRTTAKYGDRGIRYVHIETGHIAQNIYLQAMALHLGTTVVGAFHDNRLKTVLGIPEAESPICILPVGRPSDGR